MTLEEAIEIIGRRGLTPWMAWGVLKWNDGCIICATDYIRDNPDLDYLYIKKGQCFPEKPILPIGGFG